MRINLLGSFAAGILISTTIFGAVYLANPSEQSTTTVKTAENRSTVKPSEKEMKQKLETKGYVVQTKAEFEKNVNDAKASGQKTATPADNQSTKTVTKVVVNVAEGMTSIDVGKALTQASLVKDAFAFSQDIEHKGLENRLRPGVYVVDSEMTYDQMVSTIFK
ncbi:aminodeoxychorismate lyase [Neobacillus sp. MM2021_6]|uniref:aminodeoxychorismate lyase n=1 Tax=Bacillaceae TaxID=186817 RepID=UPI001A9447D9|nr:MULTISPECIES: aminodeoxychorismate lyase [Bacillaceae]MBO0962916.1 aminodeoxychorismate lyase [Neobacillus sp. MM2021_6]